MNNPERGSGGGQGETVWDKIAKEVLPQAKTEIKEDLRSLFEVGDQNPGEQNFKEQAKSVIKGVVDEWGDYIRGGNEKKLAGRLLMGAGGIVTIPVAIAMGGIDLTIAAVNNGIRSIQARKNSATNTANLKV